MHQVESMMYVREEPWHHLGQRLEAEVTAQEAIRQAGLDWEVELRPVTYIDQFKRSVEIPDKFAVVRKTDGRAYTVVGNQFTPVQNSEAFAFFDAVVGEGQAVYHTAGSLAGGAKVWILAKLPQTAAVKGVDLMENYLLLVNGHDGSLSFQMLWTPVRVVCHNTMVRALDRVSGQLFSLRHSPNIQRRVELAKTTLGFSSSMFSDFMEQAERIAGQSFLKAEMDDFLKAVLEIKPDVPLEKQPHKVKAMQRIEELVEVGAGLQALEIRGTKWALYNAVTEYVDHERMKDRDKSLNSAWFGSGAELKGRAWQMLVKN
jgi:phage/plasmid-like protein (TIGR03299 family)